MLGDLSLQTLQRYFYLSPGLEARNQMLPPGRRLAHSVPDHARKAGVLVALIPDKSDLRTLVLQRSLHPDDPHSGQISFPGGSQEHSDKDIVDTALREAFEETGIQRDKISVIGSLEPMYIPVSGFVITPVVGFISAIPEIRLSPEESQAAFFVSLSRLGDTGNQSIMDWRRSNGEELKHIPYYSILPGMPIWGATAMILAEVVKWIHQLRDEITPK